jgi:DNA topoisomerase-1
MKGDKWKLYELIVRRFLATLGEVAEAEVTDVTIEVVGEQFQSSGYVLKKAGWKKYYGKYLKATDTRLPKMAVGDEIDVRSMQMVDSETKPPYRYNQGSLIQEMDRLQLGTKSTRHDIIGKLYSRNYVQGNYMIPTPSGIALTKSLEVHGGGITEPEMTARLEADMLKITDGERTLESVVKESQDMLHDVAVKISSESTEIGQEIRSALHSQQHIGVCPSCGNNMTVKRSKNGNFIGCDGYPECKMAFPMPRGALVQTTDTKCPVCGLPQLRIIRKGNPPSVQCIDPKCQSNIEKNDLGICPACEKGHIRIMFSKAGKRFAGCSEWPACTQTYPLRPRGTIKAAGRSCSICKAPMISLGTIDECINPDCPGKKKSSRTKKTVEKKASERVRNQ